MIHSWQSQVLEDYNNINQHNSKSVEWVNVSKVIIDVCIALHPLNLPPYVLLEIIDYFEFYREFVNHKQKIDLIVNVRKSIENQLLNRNKK